ncbi:hypothetical protein Fmac_028980 [Flemingia macrophylla]|uniref:DUF4220 domain-containing protein n=1 Tax=Flemingia macrophylla TaxID=520843 RepID=A0ABD1L945_9FABA
MGHFHCCIPRFLCFVFLPLRFLLLYTNFAFRDHHCVPIVIQSYSNLDVHRRTEEARASDPRCSTEMVGQMKPNSLTRPLLWSAYVLADWIATVAMGVISSNIGDIYNKGEHPKSVDPQLLAFWATFFLIHRGGPDTITAFSLEDNDLTTTIVVLVFYAKLSVKREYLDLDHIITYLLLIEALLAEIFALTSVISSGWTLMNMSLNITDVRCKKFANICLRFCGMFGFIVVELCKKFANICLRFCGMFAFVVVGVLSSPTEYITCTWTSVGPAEILMGQSNFLNMISNKILNIKSNFFLVNKLEELTSVGEYRVSLTMIKVIYKRLGDKTKLGTQSIPSSSLGYRNLLLEKNVPIFARELELHRTIITWHIAISLFYYHVDDSSSKLEERENCKVMSDYMFYLLEKQRQMLPVGAGLVTLRDTVIEAQKFLVVLRNDLGTVSRTLLDQHDITIARDEISEMDNTSVLFHACAVAKQLIAEESRELTWKFVEDLWIEVMSYASAQCRVDMHAHQLRRGPEFLSHVWLVQAHLGLLEQFQITPRQTSV